MLSYHWPIPIDEILAIHFVIYFVRIRYRHIVSPQKAQKYQGQEQERTGVSTLLQTPRIVSQLTLHDSLHTTTATTAIHRPPPHLRKRLAISSLTFSNAHLQSPLSIHCLLSVGHNFAKEPQQHLPITTTTLHSSENLQFLLKTNVLHASGTLLCSAVKEGSRNCPDVFRSFKKTKIIQRGATLTVSAHEI